MSLFAKSCNHDFTFHGWSYVKCKLCGLTKTDEALNAKLQEQRWERIREEVPDHPMFTKEAINNEIRKRGRENTHGI